MIFLMINHAEPDILLKLLYSLLLLDSVVVGGVQYSTVLAGTAKPR